MRGVNGHLQTLQLSVCLHYALVSLSVDVSKSRTFSFSVLRGKIGANPALSESDESVIVSANNGSHHSIGSGLAGRRGGVKQKPPLRPATRALIRRRGSATSAKPSCRAGFALARRRVEGTFEAGGDWLIGICGDQSTTLERVEL